MGTRARGWGLEGHSGAGGGGDTLALRMFILLKLTFSLGFMMRSRKLRTSAPICLALAKGWIWTGKPSYRVRRMLVLFSEVVRLVYTR